MSESGSGSPAATPSVNGSIVTIGAAVVVVVDVEEGVVVEPAGLVAGAAVDPLVVESASVSVDALSLSPLHAASAAATVPARNPRLVSRGGCGGSLTPRHPCI
jgi:hypothetical protein